MATTAPGERLDEKLRLLARERLWRHRAKRLVPTEALTEAFQTASQVDPLEYQRNVMLHLLWDLDTVADVPGDVLEIGAFRGKTTAFLSTAADALELDRRVVTVDPHSEHSIEQGCTDEDADVASDVFERVTDGLGNHEHHAMLSGEAAAELADETFALIFVDGDHSYEGVLADYHNFEPLLAEGGVLVFDDYRNGAWPGVGQAVDEIVAEGDLTVERELWKTIHLRKPR